MKTKMYRIEELPDSLQYAVAEFIYSREADILIKSDGENVIEEFEKIGEDVSKTQLTVESVTFLIRNHLGYDVRNEIMEKYFAGKL